MRSSPSPPAGLELKQALHIQPIGNTQTPSKLGEGSLCRVWGLGFPGTLSCIHAPCFLLSLLHVYTWSPTFERPRKDQELRAIAQRGFNYTAGLLRPAAVRRYLAALLQQQLIPTAYRVIIPAAIRV